MGAANSLLYPGPRTCLLRRLHQAMAAPINRNAPTTAAIAMPALVPPLILEGVELAPLVGVDDPEVVEGRVTPLLLEGVELAPLVGVEDDPEIGEGRVAVPPTLLPTRASFGYTLV